MSKFGHRCSFHGSALENRPVANTFGRIFPNATAFEPSHAALVRLADTMVEQDVDVEPEDTIAEPGAASNMRFTPAGYTYLGQFIDHDLTFEATTRLTDRKVDPARVRNFRSAALDLDSVYGPGPDDAPYLYAHEIAGRMLHGLNHLGVEDLPRNSQGLALIGDKRNNENQIMGQLHLAFP